MDRGHGTLRHRTYLAVRPAVDHLAELVEQHLEEAAHALPHLPAAAQADLSVKEVIDGRVEVDRYAPERRPDLIVDLQETDEGVTGVCSGSGRNMELSF
jgi:hypothetical protein